MKRRTGTALALLLLAVGAGVAYLTLGKRTTPVGQPALVRLQAGNLEPVKQAFNAASAGPRLLVLLSPT
jgi:hypothetical protein